ncbi:DUF932 domain-containing protein [Aurantibacillus circumpalustris]|uniref:DUF932 domain-containing protein n=1 Tax=Aurantibacillus circumpalustris TaxID=3036359 RepID=UPI00295B7F9C|nr:DUF932 domain-containing protein [Aurantibacillus circumpalustris]
MAHNLETRNGKTSFASTQKAWHGLGTIVENAMTSEQAIKLANLDYEVSKVPVNANVEGLMLPVADKFATMRKDTNDIFGIVGKGYTVVQNQDAFGFFDSIVGSGQAIFETSGSLGKGERIFISAKMPEYIRIAGTDDLTEMYVVLTSSHDGSGSIVACLSPIRVVCSNTLNACLKGTSNKVSIRHTSNVQANLEQAHKFLGISNQYVKEMNECFNLMAKKTITDTQVKKLIDQLFVSEKEDSTRIKNIRDSVMTSYFTGIGQEHILGTCFGFYNGITHYFDHVKSYKDQSSKFESIVDGSSAKVVAQALNMLINI